MRLTSTGLGIGTTSPSSYNAVADNLVIGTSGSNGLTIVSGTTNDGSIHFADGTSGADAYRGQIYYSHAANYMVFSTDASERARIDSSGNLLMGMTSTSGQSGVSIVPASATYTAIHHANGSASGAEYALFISTALTCFPTLIYKFDSSFIGHLQYFTINFNSIWMTIFWK